MTDPDLEALDDSVMQRANDLAHYMHDRNLQLVVTTGETKGGIACTVIIAVGDAAPYLEQVGKKFRDEVLRLTAEAEARAKAN